MDFDPLIQAAKQFCDSMFSAEVVKDHYIWSSMHHSLAPDNFVYKERAMRQS